VGKRATRKDFETFKEAFALWGVVLGLQDWAVSYQFTALPAHAKVSYDTASRIVLVTFSNSYAVSKESIRYIAAHEAVHLALADFSICARDRFMDEYQLDREEEAVVMRFENLIIYLENKLREEK